MKDFWRQVFPEQESGIVSAQSGPLLLRVANRKKAGSLLVASLVGAMALAAFSLPSPWPAFGAVVMESNGQITDLDNMPEEDASGDVIFGTPPRRANSTGDGDGEEALPWGIVPEVHVFPYSGYRGGIPAPPGAVPSRP